MAAERSCWGEDSGYPAKDTSMQIPIPQGLLGCSALPAVLGQAGKSQKTRDCIAGAGANLVAKAGKRAGKPT